MGLVYPLLFDETHPGLFYSGLYQLWEKAAARLDPGSQTITSGILRWHREASPVRDRPHSLMDQSNEH